MFGRAYIMVLVGVGLASGLAGMPGAWAGETAFCVTCKGPDETYVCKVNGDFGDQSDALKLYCVVRTAKDGGHASCAARDDVAGCVGATKTYSYDMPDIPASLADDPRDYVAREQKKFRQDDEPSKSLVGVSRRGIRNLRASLGRDDDEPKPLPPAQEGALPELPGESAPPLPLSASPDDAATATGVPPEADETEAESKSRIRRGAQSVGSFTRKSYRCVRSLFRHCGSETEATEPN